MRRCYRRFWRKCKPIRFAVSENQPYGKRPDNTNIGSPRDGLCPGIGSWGRNLAHECRWEVKCPCASPDFDFRHRIRVGQTALEFIWIRKPLNCVKPTDYRVGVEKCGLTARGKSRHGIRPGLHPGGLRCSSVTYSRYAPSERLVRRAQPRSRCCVGLSPRTVNRSSSFGIVDTFRFREEANCQEAKNRPPRSCWPFWRASLWVGPCRNQAI